MTLKRQLLQGGLASIIFHVKDACGKIVELMETNASPLFLHWKLDQLKSNITIMERIHPELKGLEKIRLTMKPPSLTLGPEVSKAWFEDEKVHLSMSCYRKTNQYPNRRQ